MLKILAAANQRKRKPGAGDKRQMRVAIIGAYNLFPLHELTEQLMYEAGTSAEIFVGEYDNYVSELTDHLSPLHAFQPQLTIILPSASRFLYLGNLSDSFEKQRLEAVNQANSLLSQIDSFHRATGSEIILNTVLPPAGFDLGPYRHRTLGSPWNFTRLVNTELGLGAPGYVQICDLEFLAYRRGWLDSRDTRSWFESKQLGSTDFLCDLAREWVELHLNLFRPPKKVLVLDLDNTLWGGIIGDEGLSGIELGDISPTGEAFKAFQRYILKLRERGILIAVCSKNDFKTAMEPFLTHPEMVLRSEHIAAFKADWRPKYENILEIARELNVGLDSLVFVDDNPAETEIVRQFTPAVATVTLPADPADYVSILEDSRHFEIRSLTDEDLRRADSYAQDNERRQHQASAATMTSYLKSLEMRAVVRRLHTLDVPRVAQLINKSNQFNLTTRRRSEAEVAALMSDPAYTVFSIRLMDRFGDLGLISVAILKREDETLYIDTWLMSCRALQRQVEVEVLNEIIRQAEASGVHQVVGQYVPSPRNGLAKNLLIDMGFQPTAGGNYVLGKSDFKIQQTQIQVQREEL